MDSRTTEVVERQIAALVSGCIRLIVLSLLVISLPGLLSTAAAFWSGSLHTQSSHQKISEKAYDLVLGSLNNDF